MSQSHLPRLLPVDQILDGPAEPDPALPAAVEAEIGRSREDRPIHGYLVGDDESGPAVSLIGGCHADEPVGPAMLDRLVAWLATASDLPEPLRQVRWRIVPHVNPDGEARNAPWTETLGPAATWTRSDPPVEVDPAAYLRHVVREAPGDDVEFGFPRPDEDPAAAEGARPENRAVASFLAAQDGPYALHGSFHGMAFAAGPWFLIDEAWIGPTGEMRDELRRRVDEAGYALHDIDRGGDKGFRRIDRGFTTRPDSKAMRKHFLERDDEETADLFRPSSMEFVRSLSLERGGDPLTLVSEMPLFLLPPEEFQADDPVRPPAVRRLKERVTSSPTEEALRTTARDLGFHPMPLRDQMRFQLLFLDAALATVLGGRLLV